MRMTVASYACYDCFKYLMTWFEARQAVKAERLNQYRVMSAAVTLVELAQSIRTTGAAMTNSEAAATCSMLSGIAKTLAWSDTQNRSVRTWLLSFRARLICWPML